MPEMQAHLPGVSPGDRGFDFAASEGAGGDAVFIGVELWSSVVGVGSVGSISVRSYAVEVK
jgi:hypothetical protein